MDTSTDNEGKFGFSHFPQVDTPIFILKAVNRNGKSFNVGISIDEMKPPEFTKTNAPAMESWYVNSDTTFLNYAKSNAFAMQQDYFPAGGHRLKEVKIRAKKVIKDSQNLNGPGNADLVLDEKFMEKAGKKNWLQLLQENIKDMRVAYKNVISYNTVYSGNLPAAIVVNKSVPWYWIHDKFVRFIIDGVELNNDLLKLLAGVGQESANIDYYLKSLNYFLESHNAEDIKGIELNYSSKYNDTYGLRFGAFDDAFIEITTRSGQGPYLYNTPGMYLYKPVAISLPKQFYKPMYAVKDTANRTLDLRSTIDWEPNITTGINGETKVFFYTADKPSTYTLIMEGADMNGNLGYKAGKISVGEPVDKSKPLKIEGK